VYLIHLLMSFYSHTAARPYPTIYREISITGTCGAKACVIDAQGLSPIFFVGSNGSLLLSSISLANGFSKGSGAAVSAYNAVQLKFEDCMFLNNHAVAAKPAFACSLVRRA
ncbi:hypothetical protein CYMTET_31891, partial [Cymbomonas tetramitiformis]